MKNYYFLLLLCSTLLMSCSKNDAVEDASQANYTIDFKISESIIDTLAKSEDGVCATMDLIAGQNYLAGLVTIERDESYLIITYTTSGNWKINATHMYAGICEDIPQTRSGNPRVGVFDYATTHSNGTNTVQYAIEVDFFDSCFCVAAHAEVSLTDDSGNTIQSETAWGQGQQFDGNSWAMYKEFCKTGCENNDDGPADK